MKAKSVTVVPPVGAALPVVYETAVQALRDCCTLDEAKHFIDASAALAAWSAIYKRNEIGRQAKQLRLHAHRRIGELALDIAGEQTDPHGAGPVAIIQKYGLSRHQADAAHQLAKLDEKKFDEFVELPVPPAPTSVAKYVRRMESLTPWKLLCERPRTPFACSGYIKNNDAVVVARSMRGAEVKAALLLARALIVWLQVFVDALIHQNQKGS